MRYVIVKTFFGKNILLDLKNKLYDLQGNHIVCNNETNAIVGNVIKDYDDPFIAINDLVDLRVDEMKLKILKEVKYNAKY